MADAATLVGALRAAGETTRLRLLALLAEGEHSVKDLTEILGQSQPRVSRHLKLLAELRSQLFEQARRIDERTLVEEQHRAVADGQDVAVKRAGVDADRVLLPGEDRSR